MNIRPGETIALTGPSGAGKTTIVRLILSFITPGRGSVYFTNNAHERIKACPESRQFISYVPQGNTLFSGTIADNLHAGCPNAAEDDLIAAAQDAWAWEFIRILPDQFNTVIGEGGLGLSEGQAQRIAIARALLRKKPILILDEATSALDSFIERKILESLRRRSSTTCIIITHRQTALEICDRAIRIEVGHIIECHPLLLMAKPQKS